MDKEQVIPKEVYEALGQDSNITDISDILPSKFHPYTFKKLYIRPLNVGEVKKLTPNLQSGFIIVEKIFEVINNVIHPKVVLELTRPDVWFICAWLRIQSFDNAPLKTKWTCPKCKHQNNLTIKLTELNPYLQTLPKEYKEPVSIQLPSGTTVKVRLHRAGDELLVTNYLKMMNEDRTSFTAEEEFVPTLAMSIVNDMDIMEKVAFAEKLGAEDLLVLQQFQIQFPHGLPPNIPTKCTGTDQLLGKECEYVNKQTRLSFRISDIIPVYEYSEYLRNAISFGKK